jgi:hypothetical protein
MTDAEQKDFLINTMVVLLRRILVYQSLEKWLTLEVGVSRGDLDRVLNSARHELAKERSLAGRLRAAIESAMQSGGADYDQVLTSLLSQWKQEGKPN